MEIVPPEIRRSHRLTNYRTAEFPYMLSTTLFGSLTHEAIERWLLNFRKDPDAEYYAARILANTLYYPDLFIRRLYRKAFYELLAWPKIREGMSDHSYEDEAAFQLEARKFMQGVLVVPLLDEGKPPESSNAVARIIKQEGIVSATNMCFQRDMLKHLGGIHTVAIIDDHVGSGQQVRDFWRITRAFDGESRDASFHELAQTLPKVSFNFVFFAGVEQSINDLRTEIPEAGIVCPELLDNRHRVFSEESEIWRDRAELHHAREALARVCTPMGVPLAGFADLDFAYATQLGTPDWSIPILNWRHNGWTPLLS